MDPKTQLFLMGLLLINILQYSRQSPLLLNRVETQSNSTEAEDNRRHQQCSDKNAGCINKESNELKIENPTKSTYELGGSFIEPKSTESNKTKNLVSRNSDLRPNEQKRISEFPPLYEPPINGPGTIPESGTFLTGAPLYISIEDLWRLLLVTRLLQGQQQLFFGPSSVYGQNPSQNPFSQNLINGPLNLLSHLNGANASYPGTTSETSGGSGSIGLPLEPIRQQQQMALLNILTAQLLGPSPLIGSNAPLIGSNAPLIGSTAPIVSNAGPFNSPSSTLLADAIRQQQQLLLLSNLLGGTTSQLNSLIGPNSYAQNLVNGPTSLQNPFASSMGPNNGLPFNYVSGPSYNQFPNYEPILYG